MLRFETYEDYQIFLTRNTNSQSDFMHLHNDVGLNTIIERNTKQWND